jgi:hypothetical protein
MAENQEKKNEGVAPTARGFGAGLVQYPAGFVFPPGHPDEGYEIPEEGPYTAPSTREEQH